MRLLLLLILVFLPWVASGHDLGMNRVELREIDDRNLVLDAWFDPERIVLAITPQPPPNWSLAPDREIIPDHPKNIVRYRFTRDAPDPPDAALILPWDRQALAIRTINSAGESSSLLLRRSKHPFQLDLRHLHHPTHQASGPSFIPVGLRHIVFGWDHLLFILCFTLLLGRSWKLPTALTGFTLSHTFALYLGTTGTVSLPSALVEPLIALSITALACEIVRQQRLGRVSLTSRHPGLFSIAFGLLHGFGFAGAFGELHIPPDSTFSTLLWFTLGIELGQILIVVSGLLIGLIIAKPLKSPQRSSARLTAAYSAGLLSAVWFWSRLPL